MVDMTGSFASVMPLMMKEERETLSIHPRIGALLYVY
jgi:hypothetical protein